MCIEARVNWQSYFVRDFNLLKDRVPFYIWGKNIYVHRKLATRKEDALKGNFAVWF